VTSVHSSLYGDFPHLKSAPKVPSDPQQINTPQEFKQAVLWWHEHAGRPSIREVVSRTRTHAGDSRYAFDGVPRATVGEILNPNRQRNHDFLAVWLCLRACGVPEDKKDSWEAALGRARAPRKGGADPAPAPAAEEHEAPGLLFWLVIVLVAVVYAVGMTGLVYMKM
jgi:hypothetical protein